jgi:transcriptional regulator with XRE-family HTH domain
VQENAQLESEADVDLGREMRRVRKTRGLSLEEVAKRAGVSTGLVSQIERGIVSPSIRSLRQLSKALDVPVSWFFHADGPGFQKDSDVIVRAAHRRRLALTKSGVLKELLTPSGIEKLQMFLITLEPNASTGPEPNEGTGEKSGIVLVGSLELVIDGRIYSLWEGDSFAFDSSRPHFVSNTGSTVTRIIWITTPPIY